MCVTDVVRGKYAHEEAIAYHYSSKTELKRPLYHGYGRAAIMKCACVQSLVSNVKLMSTDDIELVSVVDTARI